MMRLRETVRGEGLRGSQGIKDEQSSLEDLEGVVVR